MKATIPIDALLPALALAARLSDAKAEGYASDVLLCPEGKQLRVVSTSAEVWAESEIATRCGGAMVATRAKQLYAAARQLSGDVSLELSGDERTLLVSGSGHASFRLPRSDAKVWPTPPAPPTGIAVDADSLRLQLEATLYAVSTDDSRLYLSGVVVDRKDGLRLWSTDGHRCSLIVREGAEGINPERPVILHPVWCRHALRLLGDVGGEVSLAIADGWSALRVGGTTLACQLVGATPPPIDQVIQLEKATAVTVDREAMLAAVQRVESIASGGVMLSPHDDGIQLERIDPLAGEARDVVACGGTWPCTIGAEGRYLAAALKCLHGEQIEIRVRGELDPIHFCAPEEGQLCVVMPMRV